MPGPDRTSTFVARTKIAYLGPGQFIFVPTKTKIAVFGLRQQVVGTIGRRWF